MLIKYAVVEVVDIVYVINLIAKAGGNISCTAGFLKQMLSATDDISHFDQCQHQLQAN